MRQRSHRACNTISSRSHSSKAESSSSLLRWRSFSPIESGFAATTSYVLAVSLMFAAGFLNLSFVSMAQALVQLEAPGHLRGRVIGLFYLANSGLRAFRGITIGLLGSLIGIHWSLALSAMVLLAITVVLLAFSVRTGQKALIVIREW